MKKITLLIAVLAMSVCTAVNAQDFKKGFSVAPKIGLNVASISVSGEEGISKKSKIGFNVGVFGQYRFTKAFALEAGLAYSMEGVKLEGDIDGNKVTVNETIGYLNIPITAKWYAFKGLNIFAGPQIGIKIHDKAKITGGEEGNGNVETFAFSGVAGVGYDFKFGLLVHANYNFGLTNIIKADGSGKSNVFQVGIGWRF